MSDIPALYTPEDNTTGHGHGHLLDINQHQLEHLLMFL